MVTIKINGIPVIEYNSFSVERTIDNFVDTFSCGLNNNGGAISRKFPIGNIFSVLIDDIEIFRGLIESKNVTYDSIGNKLDIRGREELVFLTEDEISPKEGKYKNLTDNYIIEHIAGGNGWVFDLGESKKISEYELSQGVKRGQVIEDIAKLNNFIIIKKGKTIYKKKRPSLSKPGPLKSTFRMSIEGGKFHNFNNRIISIDLSEDISQCRSNILGYTYKKDRTKSIIKEELKNQYLLDGNYHKRLRNQVSWQGSNIRIKRLQHLTVPVKDQKELGESLKNARIESDIKIKVGITLYGYINLDLLDCVEVIIESEGVSQYMYVTGITYNYDSSNKFTSKIDLVPLLPNDLA